MGENDGVVSTSHVTGNMFRSSKIGIPCSATKVLSRLLQGLFMTRKIPSSDVIPFCQSNPRGVYGLQEHSASKLPYCRYSSMLKEHLIQHRASADKHVNGSRTHPKSRAISELLRG